MKLGMKFSQADAEPLEKLMTSATFLVAVISFFS